MTQARLIGPPRDRRNAKRWLTVKNVSFSLFALLLMLIAVSLLSEVRRGKPGQFGRLYDRRTREVRTEAPREPIVIVEEDPLPDRKPDPMLVGSTDREAVLGVQQLPPHPPSVEEPIELSGVAPLGEYDGPTKKKPGKARFEIVGGAGGVQVKVQ